MSDIIVRGQSTDGAIRVFTAVTTDLVNEAQRLHGSFPTATAALGRTLTVAAMMGQGLKNDTDSITIQFLGDGPLGSMVAVTDNKSRVRGYASNPYVDLPLNKNGKLDVGGAVGKGQLNVIYDLSLKEPYSGQVPIMTGEIAEDMTYYFAKSEQIPTAIGLGVLVGTDERAEQAGGFMIQLMPEASEETAGIIEDRIKTVPPVTQLLSEGMTAQDMLFYLTEDFDMIMENQTVTPMYKCKCSQKRMRSAVISIGRKEIRKMIDEDEKCEIECRFCNNKYVFGRDELEEMYKQAR
ncbi:MAG: Hsp33 family molecular chaperone HslO [Clostridiales bacterium]|nr:Hsp33 family molecular chaperone HslO [Clostridiales bacterium]